LDDLKKDNSASNGITVGIGVAIVSALLYIGDVIKERS
jgi:hypothetical protein